MPMALRRPPDGTSYAKQVSGKRTHRIIKGVGHNLRVVKLALPP
jgi:hypothetical protein